MVNTNVITRKAVEAGVWTSMRITYVSNTIEYKNGRVGFFVKLSNKYKGEATKWFSFSSSADIESVHNYMARQLDLICTEGQENAVEKSATALLNYRTKKNPEMSDVMWILNHFASTISALNNLTNFYVNACRKLDQSGQEYVVWTKPKNRRY